MKTSHSSAISVAQPFPSVNSAEQMQEFLSQAISEGVQSGISNLFGTIQQDIRRLSECVLQNTETRPSSTSLGTSVRPSYSTQTSQESLKESSLWVRPYMQMCNQAIDPSVLSLAVALYGWPVVEDELRRSEIDLDIVQSGLGAEFLDAFPLKGAQKLRLRQRDGVLLPFFPGKTSITFGWKAGDDPQPERLNLRWLTGPRDNPRLVFEWVKNHKQHGSLYTCGDQVGACIEVDFPARRYCSAGPVGMYCYLYLEIEGKPTLSSTLESVTVTTRFAEPPRGCGCEACAHGTSQCYSGCVVPG